MKGNYNIVTWKDAARLLHALRPGVWTTWALAHLFNKNQGTIYYVLYPAKRAEMEKKRSQQPIRQAKRRVVAQRQNEKRKARRHASKSSECA